MEEIKIISIEKKPRSTKYRVVTNEEEYIFSEDMIVKYQILKGKVFSTKQFEMIIESLLEDEYFNKIINLLSFSNKSEYEIVNYIHTVESKNKHYLKQKQVENIIEKLKEYNYINDQQLCKSLIDYYIRNSKGPLYIKQKLKEKKIDEKIIDNELSVYNYNLEEEIIVKLISKEINQNYPEKKFKMNLCNKLMRNGFNQTLVYKIVSDYKFEDNSELLIEKDYLKIYNRVKDKNKTLSEKKQLIFNGLISKGYEYSLIKEYMNKSSNL